MTLTGPCVLSRETRELFKDKECGTYDLGAGVLGQEQLCPRGYSAKSKTSRDSIGWPETQNLWPKVSVKPAWEPGP